jgi:AAA domain
MPAFTKAVKSATRLRMALAGPSGCGKTYTALSIASALGSRVALIDTERGGASYYADQFDFDTLELTSFHPEQYIKALHAAADEHYEVVIVDSLSHAWFGKDGALELVDREAKRSQSKNSYFAWREVTPLHNKLVDALVQAPVHVLVTLRTKTEYLIETQRDGKQVPTKVGMAPIQRDGLEYEFDVFADMDHAHNLIITKSRITGLADAVVERPDRAFGTRIATALTTGVSSTPPSPKPRALDATEFAVRMEAIWTAGGLPPEEMQKRWGMLTRRCGSPIPEKWYAGLLEEQQGWVTKRSATVAATVAQEGVLESQTPGNKQETPTDASHSPHASGLQNSDAGGNLKHDIRSQELSGQGASFDYSESAEEDREAAGVDEDGVLL